MLSGLNTTNKDNDISPMINVNKDSDYLMDKKMSNDSLFIGFGLLFILLIVLYVLYLTQKNTSSKVYVLGTDILDVTAPGLKIKDYYHNILFKGDNSNIHYRVDFTDLKPPNTNPIHIYYDIGIDNDNNNDNNTKLTLFFGPQKLVIGSGLASTITFNNSGLSVSVSYFEGKWRAINLGADVDTV